MENKKWQQAFKKRQYLIEGTSAKRDMQMRLKADPERAILEASIDVQTILCGLDRP